MAFSKNFCICFNGAPEENVTEVSVSGENWRTFSLKELEIATDHFNENHKLGEGGFGSVYWGTLADKSQVAVKRLKIFNTSNEKSFTVEVEALGRVRHKNLLRLRGYCADGQERLIVYSYMPNLSLLQHLHGKEAADGALNWDRRMCIAIGTAEGLKYLHEHVNPHIIHRDVKASNILLDSHFEAQVADFGFAKFIPEGVSHLTTRVKGTLGYLAPEYALLGKVTKSCDVYSFGILLLELVSGKRPIEKLADGRKRTIVEWAAPLIFQCKFPELVDPKLQGVFNLDQLLRVVEAAALCAQSRADNRPTMGEIVHLLKGRNSDFSSFRNPKSIPIEAVKYQQEMLAADDDEVH